MNHLRHRDMAHALPPSEPLLIIRLFHVYCLSYTLLLFLLKKCPVYQSLSHFPSPYLLLLRKMLHVENVGTKYCGFLSYCIYYTISTVTQIQSLHAPIRKLALREVAICNCLATYGHLHSAPGGAEDCNTSRI